MTEQTKELIAIAASVAAHCQPCLKYHYSKARELGVEIVEINAAIDIGYQVARGAGKAIRDFQETLIPGESTSTSAAGGCCGGGETGGDSKCC